MEARARASRLKSVTSSIPGLGQVSALGLTTWYLMCYTNDALVTGKVKLAHLRKMPEDQIVKLTNLLITFVWLENVSDDFFSFEKTQKSFQANINPSKKLSKIYV